MRLSQHIEKGNEDGLFISCVASCSNLWALIMDAGTGFTAQVYELSPCFLHKVGSFFHEEENKLSWILDMRDYTFMFVSHWINEL